MPNKIIKLKGQWSSKTAFILAATGAAVGLGNIWRFPYMAGENGGSAFVLVYLLCVLIIGIPVMFAEILIGRYTKQNPVDAMANGAKEMGHTHYWGLVGWWGALGLLLVLSFYSVVSGWAVSYLFRAGLGQFNGLNSNQVNHIWTQFLASPGHMLFWHTVFMLLTITVIIGGVTKGLERASKLMTPGLYIILIALVVYAAIEGNFSQAWHYLFHFDIQKITSSIIIAAMGHAFFTLALGAGAMLTYGAYVPKNVNIVHSCLIVTFLDVLVAFLSGMAIFPLVFAYHLPAQSGPGLMFVTLPIAFAQIPGGMIIGSLFFLLLIFAAWTSSINLAEPMVIILMRFLKISRLTSALLVGGMAWLLGIGSILSFNLWQHLIFFNHFTVFDLATNIPTDIILPIGGFCFAIFCGWVLKKYITMNELNIKFHWYFIWRFLIRYISPIGIIIILINGLSG